MNVVMPLTLFSDYKSNAFRNRSLEKWKVQGESKLHIVFLLPFAILLGDRVLLNALGYLFTYGNILPN